MFESSFHEIVLSFRRFVVLLPCFVSSSLLQFRRVVASFRVHYKPTVSHSYLLHSSSHPSHVKNSIPFSQFLRLRRLCSDDSDFSNKLEEMRHFFKKRGYPDSLSTNTAQHRAQQIDRQSALQTSQKEKNERIPFTLTYHPHNLAAENIILKNFKLLQNDNETGSIFSKPPLVSFKRDKNIGNFLVRSVLNLMINQVLLFARANDATLVLSFTMRTK